MCWLLNSKTNTIWNIIKTETNRKGMKVNMFCFSSGNDENFENFDIIKIFPIILIFFCPFSSR